MNYQLSQDGKTIKGMPEMEKPKPPFRDEQFNKMVKSGVIQSENDYVDYRYEVDQYEKHIASLPIFNCHPSLSEKYEPGAVLVEGKDFELRMVYDWLEGIGEACKNAFPISVTEDDDLLILVSESIHRSGGLSTCRSIAQIVISDLKQHYTLTPKQ